LAKGAAGYTSTGQRAGWLGNIVDTTQQDEQRGAERQKGGPTDETFHIAGLSDGRLLRCSCKGLRNPVTPWAIDAAVTSRCPDSGRSVTC
jgi:hypothetical protein